MEPQSIVAMVQEAQKALQDKKEVRVRLIEDPQSLRVAAIETKSQINVAGPKSRGTLLYVEAQLIDRGRVLIAPQHLVAIIIS